MDLAITYNDRELTFAPAVQNVDLATESGLRSAVLVSLFTDRRAADDDPLPSSALDLRGWWADAWPEMAGDLVGSRLWLLSREKQTAAVLHRAREYSEEALAWLIEDHVATAVAVSAEWIRTGMLRLQVAITLADQTRFKDVFNYQLQAA